MNNQFNVKTITIEELRHSDAQLIDVREPFEYEMGSIEGAVNIPLSLLESRLSEIDQDKLVIVYCQVGQRGSQAAELLHHAGYEAANLEGGYRKYKESQQLNTVAGNYMGRVSQLEIKEDRRMIEASGMQCPGPILKVKENIEQMESGEQLEIHVTDFGFCTDIDAWAKATGNIVISNKTEDGKVKAIVQKGHGLPINVMNDKDGHQLVETKNGATMVVFSGDLDKALASFIIATGAASYGKEVTMFFTFWGLNVIKKKGVRVTKKGLDKVFSQMMPKHAGRLPISKMNLGGMGAHMIRYVMNKKKVDSLETMIEKTQSMGVKMVACTMSMDIMAVTKEELIDGVEYGGVATYLGDTEKSNLNLFI